ncbi:HAD-like domain-containing protein [Xylaria acuta]|nr:HAD-like domain-containing protein [Xylaria acuta]
MSLLLPLSRTVTGRNLRSRLRANCQHVEPVKTVATTGTKLHTFRNGEWQRVCADLFSSTDKEKILEMFDLSLEKTGFKPGTTWGNRIEDRGTASIDVIQNGVDKGCGLKRLRDQSGIPLEQMMLGLKTVKAKNPDGTLAAIAGIVACLSE